TLPAFVSPLSLHDALPILKAADILERRQMEVVGLLASETGCTFGFGMFQTIFTPNLLRQVASLPYQPTGEILPADLPGAFYMGRSEEHTSELQSLRHLVCR